MIIGHPQRTNKVKVTGLLNLNDSKVKLVAQTKSLAVMVDEGLNRDDQFSKMKGKIERKRKRRKERERRTDRGTDKKIGRRTVMSERERGNRSP